MHDAIEGPTVAEAASIQGMLAKVHEALREHDEVLALLRDRLGGVLTPLETTPYTDADRVERTPPTCSPLLSEVTRVLEIVQEQTRALAGLASRVEL